MFNVEKKLVVNSVRVKIVSDELSRRLSFEKVVIIDEYNDVSPLEAEHIVKYLFNEGFIRTDEVPLEIVKMKY